MKHAYVFPGQGAQAVGMGIDVYDNVPEAKELFEKAQETAADKYAKLVKLAQPYEEK